MAWARALVALVSTFLQWNACGTCARTCTAFDATFIQIDSDQLGYDEADWRGELELLRKLGIKRIALMGDNGGFGRDGVGQVQTLAKRYGFEITDSVIFAPTTTSFTAELTKIKNSNAQAVWLWTVTPAAATIVKEVKQLQLSQRLVLTGGNLAPQFLQ